MPYRAQMVLINPSINRDKGALDIEVPSPSPDTAPQSFSVPLAHPTSYLDDPTDDPSLDHDFVVWGSDPQDGFSVGTDDLRAALSAFMGREVLLIRKGLTRRSVADVPGVVHSEGLDPVLGFADFYPFLIGSAKSLECVPLPLPAGPCDGGPAAPRLSCQTPLLLTLLPRSPSELMSRIPSLSADPAFDSSRWSPSAIASKGGLEISRFRANIVVEGTSEPWEEDGWKQLVIREEPIEVGFRCARCMRACLSLPAPRRCSFLPSCAWSVR